MEELTDVSLNEEPKPLVEKVTDQIIELILENGLKSGDKLPNEYELATSLFVGRSTVREAIKALTARNVLEIKRGAGTYVSQKMGVSDDPLGLMFIKDKKKLAMDLLDVRFLIEPDIASMAALHATAEDVKELFSLCQKVEDMIDLGLNHADADIELHTKIASCSKNLVVPNLIPIITTAIFFFIEFTHSALKQETIDCHREIVEAIRDKNPKAAHDAMLIHLVYNRKNISKNLDY